MLALFVSGQALLVLEVVCFCSNFQFVVAICFVCTDPLMSQKHAELTYVVYNSKRMHYSLLITKTRLYNFDPHKPNFYTVKLGFTGVYIIFLFVLKNIDCGYSLEPPRRGGSNEYQQSMFWAEIWKLSEFFICSSFVGKIVSIFE